MLTTLFAGTLLGISFCAPPGPVAVETIRRGLRGGFRGAISVQLGSIVGDTAWCAAALLGLAPLVSIPAVRALLWAAGAVALIYLGLTSIRDGLRPASPTPSPAKAGTTGSGFRSGMALALANPLSVGWWLSVGGAMMAAGVTGTGPAETGVFITGFLAGTLAWAVFFSAGVQFGASRFSAKVQRLVSFACGMALVGLALALAWQALG